MFHFCTENDSFVFESFVCLFFLTEKNMFFLTESFFEIFLGV